MNTRHRLEIVYPVLEEDFLTAMFIRDTKLDGMVCILRNNAYIFDIGDGEETAPSIDEDRINAGWITKIKMPLNFEEWKKSVQFATENDWEDQKLRAAWITGAENYRLEQEFKNDHKS